MRLFGRISWILQIVAESWLLAILSYLSIFDVYLATFAV